VINVREAFAASSSNVLIAADYAQLELRIIAALSGDIKLHSLFNRLFWLALLV
jgi:DNA polymerase I-like protein with 3'-5' exonuclease and polymerase domains